MFCFESQIQQVMFCQSLMFYLASYVMFYKRRGRLQDRSTYKRVGLNLGVVKMRIEHESWSYIITYQLHILL
jgi:hypothetical protein